MFLKGLIWIGAVGMALAMFYALWQCMRAAKAADAGMQDLRREFERSRKPQTDISGLKGPGKIQLCAPCGQRPPGCWSSKAHGLN